LWHPGQRGINGSHNPRLFRHSGGFGGNIDAINQGMSISILIMIRPFLNSEPARSLLPWFPAFRAPLPPSGESAGRRRCRGLPASVTVRARQLSVAARNHRRPCSQTPPILLTLAANAGATLLTFFASLLANIASRSPSGHFAHASCQ
jgi:hypothetical protein